MSQLSLRIALMTAAAVLGLLLLVHALWNAFTFGGGLLLVLGTGAAAYAVTYARLTRRLAQAQEALQQIRQQRFEHLDTTPFLQGDELDDLTRQIYRTGRTLEQEIEKLRKMENYRREFVGNVSHELKTPIFAIQGFAETLLGGALDDQQVNRLFIEKIQHNATRLNNLARDLTDISRIETGELEMVMEPFDLKHVVDEVIESLEPIAKEKDIALHDRVPRRLPPVRGDQTRIRQVLVNLVDNAIKYNNAGGYVEVVARALPAGEVKVSVVDNGIGIPAQHMARLTERFYRVDTSRSRSQGGTGLGLAIVKHILSAHERVLQIESSAGRGSTFGFTLPVAGKAENK